MKKHRLLFGVCALCFFVAQGPLAALDYPHFNDNPYLTSRLRSAIAPYLLPLDHPMKPALDAIFSQSRVIENEKSLVDAGFELIAGPMPLSFIIVARHPQVPGYV